MQTYNCIVIKIFRLVLHTAAFDIIINDLYRDVRRRKLTADISLLFKPRKILG